MLSSGSITQVVVNLYLVPLGREASSLFTMHTPFSGKNAQILLLPFVRTVLRTRLRMDETPEFESELGVPQKASQGVRSHSLITGPFVSMGRLWKIQSHCRYVNRSVLRNFTRIIFLIGGLE